MSNKKLLEEFYLLAEKIGIKIIKGKGDFNGGICKVNDKNVIVINNNKPIEQRLNILAKCFKSHNLKGYYILPVLRQHINDSQGLDF